MILKSGVSIPLLAALFGGSIFGQVPPAGGAKPQVRPEAEIVSSLTLESFQQIVQGMGFECTRDKDESGKLQDYFVFRAEGYKVVARVPTNEYAYLFNIFTDKVPLEVVNKWNQANSFSRASLGTDGNLYLETEIPVGGGATRDNIERQIKTFRDSVTRWARAVLDTEKANPAPEPRHAASAPAADISPPPATAPSGSYTRGPAAKNRVKTPAGDFAIWVDDAKWKPQQSDEPGVLEFAHVNGALWAKVITERIGIPTEGLKEIALVNARKVAPDARITLEEHRMVNGHELLALQITGVTKSVPFRFFGYYHGGTSGSVQVVGWTVESAFDENAGEIAAFLNGLEIGDRDLPAAESAPSEGVLMFNSKMSIKYDPRKWKQTTSEDSGRFTFKHNSGDGYALVIAERISVPTDSIPDIALANVHNADPNARIIFREKRHVNGVDVWFLKIDAVVDKIPIVYYGYYFGGKYGTVQVLTYTGKDLLSDYEKDFLEFLNGLWTGE